MSVAVDPTRARNQKPKTAHVRMKSTRRGVDSPKRNVLLTLLTGIILI